MVEERVSRLEGTYEQASERLGDLTAGVGRVDAKIEALRAETNARLEFLRAETRAETNAGFNRFQRSLESRFNATLGLLAATWARLAQASSLSSLQADSPRAFAFLPRRAAGERSWQRVAERHSRGVPDVAVAAG